MEVIIITPDIYWKLLVAYIKGSVFIEDEDKNLREMLDKNYVDSELGERFYVNGFPLRGTTTKRFITTDGRKAFWKSTFKIVIPFTTGLFGILLALLKLLVSS
ncbi:hypothetical protein [Staphylococcus chromogenes]|uniref:hypothetical protein n=1 Tax=Staphylococcus chromogenes TaxID=46126 RepID=UPI002DB5DD4C|nr:hypothetical protein [Staphylococcus chromogenes]MEB7824963.1 hypothetical protein [Staphylococcus chromogenes]